MKDYLNKKYRRAPHLGVVQKKEVKKIVDRKIDANAENKYNYISGNDLIFNVGGQNLSPSFLTKGVNVNQRIGNIVKIKKIEWRCNMYLNSTQTSPATVRMLMFYDKEVNGVQPGNADIFLDNTSPNVVWSPLNPTNFPSRFTILKDKTFSLNMGGGSTNVPIEKTVVIKKKINKKTQFNSGNVGTVADVIKGVVWCAIYSDQGINVPYADYSMTQYFEDS